MKIIVLLNLAAFALARPDVGLGYHYKVPATSYGVPSGSVPSLHNTQHYHVETQNRAGSPNLQSNIFGPTVPSTVFQAPIHEPVSFSGSTTFGSDTGNLGPSGTFTQQRFSSGPFVDSLHSKFNIGDGSSVPSSSGHFQSNLISGSSAPGGSLNFQTDSSSPSSVEQSSGVHHFQSGSSAPGGSFNLQTVSSTPTTGQSSVGNLQTTTFGVGSSGLSNRDQGTTSFNLLGDTQHTQTGNFNFESKSSFSSQSSQQAEVQKHLYFYAAPEEPGEITQRINIPVPAPKKNIKILFIKAPTYHAPAPVQIPLQPQNEEKTLVYVLVKKPEEQGAIDIPTPVPTQPSKPEVYFIKYKTKQEAEEAISKLQSGQAVSGSSVNANTIEGDKEFISTIDHDVHSSGPSVNFVTTTDTRGSFNADQSSRTSNSGPSFISTGPNVGSTSFSSGSSDTSTKFNSGPSGSSSFISGTSSSLPSSSSSAVHTISDSGIGGSINYESSPNSDSGSSVLISGGHSDGGASSNSFDNFGGSTTPSSLDVLSFSTSKPQVVSRLHETYGPPH